MSGESVLELQNARDTLKQNLQDMDENIKKMTGRDPADNRRLSTSRRVPLKRISFGQTGSNQPPHKRAPGERRRWGLAAISSNAKLDSGGEEEEEEKKPAVHSSVVATGNPITPAKRPILEDNKTKTRNKRMFGLLLGTLKQFKRDSQVRAEQDFKREEKLTKVEVEVKKDQDDALKQRKVMYQTRRDKQQELKKLEFKLEMAELNVELKDHYKKFTDFIQLKSTPRVFYKPAVHNKKTLELLEESTEAMSNSLEQRLKEIEMCTEEDIFTATRILRSKSLGKSAKDPIIVDHVPPTARDLFAEDADNDKREREAVQKTDTEVDVSKSNETVEEVVRVNGNTNQVVMSLVPVIERIDVDIDDEFFSQQPVCEVEDKRKVISDSSNFNVVDERVVELSNDTRRLESGDTDDKAPAQEGDDSVNIYEDMQQGIDVFQAEDIELA